MLMSRSAIAPLASAVMGRLPMVVYISLRSVALSVARIATGKLARKPLPLMKKTFPVSRETEMISGITPLFDIGFGPVAGGVAEVVAQTWAEKFCETQPFAPPSVRARILKQNVEGTERPVKSSWLREP